MPIIDSSSKLILGDPKPEQRCYWRFCSRSKESTTRTKLCAQCRLVRYCSKRCQKADWKQHRNVCREPGLLDIGAWISTHEPELKWASAQALGGYDGPNMTSTHGMIFRLIRSDRLPAERSSGPFVMFDAVYMAMEEMASHFPMDNLYSESDRQESAEIKRKGGFGVAFAVFEIQGMPQGTAFWFRRFKLGLPGPGGLVYEAEWRWTVKNVVNDTFYDADVMRTINTALLPLDPTTVTVASDELQDEVD